MRRIMRLRTVVVVGRRRRGSRSSCCFMSDYSGTGENGWLELEVGMDGCTRRLLAYGWRNGWASVFFSSFSQEISLDT